MPSQDISLNPERPDRICLMNKKGEIPMRLKHWQGYGTVDAKRTEFRMNPDGTNTVAIKITGQHEYGLVRDDVYDVHRWLLKRFAKDCPDYRSVTDMKITEPADDTAVYEITYRPGTA